MFLVALNKIMHFSATATIIFISITDYFIVQNESEQRDKMGNKAKILNRDQLEAIRLRGWVTDH